MYYENCGSQGTMNEKGQSNIGTVTTPKYLTRLAIESSKKVLAA